MKVQTLLLGSESFGLSLKPETLVDKEVLKKFFEGDIKITAYDTIDCYMILEAKLKNKKYVFKGPL